MTCCWQKRERLYSQYATNITKIYKNLVLSQVRATSLILLNTRYGPTRCLDVDAAIIDHILQQLPLGLSLASMVYALHAVLRLFNLLLRSSQSHLRLQLVLLLLQRRYIAFWCRRLAIVQFLITRTWELLHCSWCCRLATTHVLFTRTWKPLLRVLGYRDLSLHFFNVG